MFISAILYPIPFDLGSQASLSWSSSGLRNHLRSPSDLAFSFFAFLGYSS